MKKGLADFKEEVLNGHTFDGKFKNITSMDDVFQIAKSEGYEFSIDELEDSEISDDIIDSVAGGKNDKNIREIVNDTGNSKVILKESDAIKRKLGL